MRQTLRGVACLGLVLMACASTVAAQEVFSRGMYGPSYVTELQVGIPFTPQHLQPYPNRGFHYSGSLSLLYNVNLLPGNYTLGLAYPATNRGVVVSLFDRWPYDSSAKRVELPMGPVVRTNTKRIDYHWMMGIAPSSTSTALYIVVEMPPTVGGYAPFPHTVYLMPSSASPLMGAARGVGVTSLQGPTDLVLVNERETVAYVIERPSKIEAKQTQTVLPIPGDLIRNPWFKDGLNQWTLQRDYRAVKDADTVSMTSQGVRLKSVRGRTREGLMQVIDADVAGADALVLRADIKVDRQTLPGTGSEGHEAPVAVAVCYTDASGVSHCQTKGFWQGFYALVPQDPYISANGERVPEGEWYRYIFDLMQLDPSPARIRSIFLEGSGWPEREAWVRDVHLILKGGKP